MQDYSEQRGNEPWFAMPAEHRPGINARILIKGFEGLRLKAYDDGFGNWTIGYGHTHGVKEGDKCTMVQALVFLTQDLNHVAQCINETVKVKVSVQEYDTLCSWIFNCGCSQWRAAPALTYLNRGDYDTCIKHMQLYDRAGDHVVPGLRARRAAEARLWNMGKAKS